MHRTAVVAAIAASVALAVGTVVLSSTPATADHGGHGGEKVVHLRLTVKQQAFTGNLSDPKLGDQFLINGDVFDDSGTEVGRAVTSCTVASVPPRATEVACLGDTVLRKGKITIGGVAPFPPPGTPVRFSIVGGTGDFRTARGEFVVTNPSPDPALSRQGPWGL
jgi:hypothetical protein